MRRKTEHMYTQCMCMISHVDAHYIQINHKYHHSYMCRHSSLVISGWVDYGDFYLLTSVNFSHCPCQSFSLDVFIPTSAIKGPLIFLKPNEVKPKGSNFASDSLDFKMFGCFSCLLPIPVSQVTGLDCF
jgi:hypothetical protein